MDYWRHLKAKKNATADSSTVADTIPFELSKQMPAVLPKGEEVKKYKGKTIRRRADGRWWARYYVDGKQICVYGRTRDECYNKLKKAVDGKGNADKPGKPKQNITLGEWLQKWLELYKVGQVKDSTLYKQNQYIKQLANLHKVKLQDITPIVLQQFLMEIDKPRKREILYVVLNDALQRATDNGLMPNNPCKLVKIPKNKRTPQKALTTAEEKRIVNACMQDKFGVMFLFCLYEGLRIGEVKALTETDIDFTNNTISITKAINDFNKIDTPKSETSKRIIPLFARMRQTLSVKPFQKMTGDNHIYEHWNSICEQANVQCNVHSLRHTFATRCAEAGISPKLTQQWLGHSTIQVTMDVYTHINAEFEAKEVAKFDTHFDTYGN